MQEKKVSMEDAFKVWWFMTWRTVLTSISVFIVLSIVFGSIGMSESSEPLMESASFIISVLISVFFVKLALNRDYKDFRLSVLSKDNENKYGKQ